MGLFQHKHSDDKSLPDDTMEAVDLLFDDQFREELRTHGREYFERVVDENAALFKQDLDATIAHINTELRQHISRQLDQQVADINRVSAELRQHVAARFDEQFEEYGKAIKTAQDESLKSLEQKADHLEHQHQQLGANLEKSLAYQDAMLTNSVEESKNQITAMKHAQSTALQSLADSVKELEEQHKQLGTMMHETVLKQQDMLMSAFEENMAATIEHYLVGALGDQFDLKAQLPGIIQQMESNKQAMMDDMKL